MGTHVVTGSASGFVDGGTDALFKPTWPRSAYVPKPVMDLATRAFPIATGIRKRLSR